MFRSKSCPIPVSNKFWFVLYLKKRWLMLDYFLFVYHIKLYLCCPLYILRGSKLDQQATKNVIWKNIYYFLTFYLFLFY